jgi:hypothetical protein
VDVEAGATRGKIQVDLETKFGEWTPRYGVQISVDVEHAPFRRAPFGRCTYRSMITGKLSRAYLFSRQRFRRHEGKCNSSFRPWHARPLHWTCPRLPRISSTYLGQRKISDLPSISRSLRAGHGVNEKRAARSAVAECRPIPRDGSLDPAVILPMPITDRHGVHRDLRRSLARGLGTRWLPSSAEDPR